MKSCGMKAKEPMKDAKKDMGNMMKAGKKLASILPLGKKGVPKKGK